MLWKSHAINLAVLKRIWDSLLMATDPTQPIQDEALRLTLSRQEGSFILERQASSRRRLIFWILLALIAAIGTVVFSFWMGTYQPEPDAVDYPQEYYGIFFSLCTAILLMLVGFLKVPFAMMDVWKYRRYRAEYETFLAKFGRNR